MVTSSPTPPAPRTPRPGRLRRTRAPLAVAVAIALLATTAATGAAAATVVTPVATAASDEVELALELQVGPMSYGFGPEEWQVYVVRITNVSDADVRVGISVDVRQQGVIEPLWESDFLAGTGLDPADPDQAAQLQAIFSPVIEPGSTFESPVPDWPGFTYVFSQLDPSPDELTRVTSAGLYVPMPDFSLPDGGITAASLSGPELFPGLTATVTASGLPPGRELGVWMAPGLDYFSFLLSGALLPADAFEAGRAVVGADGTYSATVIIPPDTPLGGYQLVVGDPATRSWPAGAVDSFTIAAAPQTVSAAVPAGDDVVAVLESASADITVVFASVSVEGVTTLAVSSTGPVLDGFQFAAEPPLYYHLDTTATYTGPIEVCLDYDPATVTTPPRLYHFESDQWVDITTSSIAGRVCGETSSFSPFVVGLPNGVELANKQQCKDEGWRASTLPVFTNQGTCVSWFQARGR